MGKTFEDLTDQSQSLSDWTETELADVLRHRGLRNAPQKMELIAAVNAELDGRNSVNQAVATADLKSAVSDLKDTVSNAADLSGKVTIQAALVGGICAIFGSIVGGIMVAVVSHWLTSGS